VTTQAQALGQGCRRGCLGHAALEVGHRNRDAGEPFRAKSVSAKMPRPLLQLGRRPCAAATAVGHRAFGELTLARGVVDLVAVSAGKVFELADGERRCTLACIGAQQRASDFFECHFCASRHALDVFERSFSIVSEHRVGMRVK